MNCPNCGSAQVRKNGHRRNKQNYRCKECDRQFVKTYSQRGYSSDVKQICLKMHQSGIGFREIERLTGISHNTVINWVRQTQRPSEPTEPNEPSDSSEWAAAPISVTHALKNLNNCLHFS